MEKITNKNFRTTKEVKLPSGVTVEIYSSLLVGEVSQLDLKKSEMEIGVQTMVKIIKSWNFFEDEKNDTPLEITTANVGKLPVADLEFLGDQVKIFSEEVKKN